MKDLELLWAGGNVKRFHSYSCTVQTDTVGHHSYNVASLITVLLPGASAALLVAALRHDVGEAKTGDMPAPAKRDMGIRDIFGEYEEDVMAKAGVDFPTLTTEEAWLLKVCDSMDGMRFCVQERAMGNRLIAEAYGNFRGYVMQLIEDAPFLAGDYVGVYDRVCRVFNYLKDKFNECE